MGQINRSVDWLLWAEVLGGMEFRYGIQIAALSETRLADVGEIKIVGAEYTFFWSGRKREERCFAGVGFVIKTELVGKLSGLPKCINDRLMTLRLPMSGNKHRGNYCQCLCTHDDQSR